MNKKRSGMINNVLTYGACLIGSIFVLVPVLWMVSTSLKTEPETFAIPPRWIPETVTLDSYRAMWVDYPFLYYFRNSIIVTLAAVAISVSISCLTGYGVTRFRFKGKESFLGFVLLTQMFPSVMLLVPYYKVLNTYGLNNTLIGLGLVYISFTVPFCSWILRLFPWNWTRRQSLTDVQDGRHLPGLHSLLLFPEYLPRLFMHLSHAGMNICLPICLWQMKN